MTSIWRRSPVRLSLSLALLFAAALAGLFWYGLGESSRWVAGVLCWLIASSITAFIAYGLDKKLSQAGGWRIPESTLHVLALIGGSIGALIAMQLFRHKTAKGSFRIVFAVILAAQTIAAVALVVIWLRQ